jgi:hypothetical protein
MSKPIKAESADFTTIPFYLIQTNGPDKRYVASLQDKSKLLQFMQNFIQEMESVAEVRIVELDDVEDPVQYSGVVEKSELLRIIETHDEVIFHHGKYDFMLRNPYSGDYFAFDEHGLLFIYTDQDYSKILNELGAEHRPNELLIYEFDHWHIGIPEGEERLAALINDLNLEQD